MVALPRSSRVALAALALGLLLFASFGWARPARRARRPAPTARPATLAPPADCAWRVLDVRDPREHEDAWEPRHPLLREPLDPNRVPGLPPLVAVVGTDAQRHPHLSILNEARGTSHRVGGDRWLSQPRWSPDGRTLACTVWKSRQRPWSLCLVDVASGRVTEPDLDLQVASMRWSPDSRHLAVSGARSSRDAVVLAVVDVDGDAPRIMDSLGVVADHEASWSPDGSTLAVVRPTALAVGQEIVESQLWLIALDGRRCPIVRAPGRVVREPGWVDARRVRFVQHAGHERPEAAVARLAVVEPRPATP